MFLGHVHETSWSKLFARWHYRRTWQFHQISFTGYIVGWRISGEHKMKELLNIELNFLNYIFVCRVSRITFNPCTPQFWSSKASKKLFWLASVWNTNCDWKLRRTLLNQTLNTGNGEQPRIWKPLVPKGKANSSSTSVTWAGNWKCCPFSTRCEKWKKAAFGHEMSNFCPLQLPIHFQFQV